MSDDTFTRREFTRELALGASALPALACFASNANIAKSDDAPVEAGRPVEAKENRAAIPALSLEEQADQMVRILASRYPHPQMTPGILDQIRKDVQGDLVSSMLLSSYPLKNSDGPGFVFTPWRGDSVGT